MPTRRNILLVLTHGLRCDAVSEGVWPIEAPNFLKLADRSFAGIATSACPADAGGMLTLLTGLHARQHGQVNTRHHIPATDSLVSHLRDVGYHLVGVGQVQPILPMLHDAVCVQSPDAPNAGHCAYLDAMQSRGLYDALVQQRKQRERYGPFDPDRLLLEPDDDIDGYIGRAAEKKLREIADNTKKPWALIVAFTGPGNDLPPPTLYDGLVNPRLLEAGFIPAHVAEVDPLAELDYPRVMLQRLEPHQVGRIRSDYLGRVSLIDQALGRMMRAVEDRRDNESVWTVIASDRGQLLGEHGLIGHRSFLSAALETPIYVTPPVSAPVNTPNRDVLLSTVDVAPTVLDLAGCDQPEAWVGRSLLDLMRNPDSAATRPSILISEFGQRLCMETMRHKMVFEVKTNTVVGLYDMVNDPMEKDNLVGQPRGADVIDSLRVRLGEALMPLRALGA
ncbi:MAG: sulfatase-like hydrolase/transferase [Phycisphaera sp.]|nr:sulfatase-like hydrolase/transferase [Phycisphaera sp.]